MTATTAPAWISDLTVDTLADDPYPVYARLRAEAPCVFAPQLGAWVVSTYDDIRDFLADADLSLAPEGQPVLARTFGSQNILISNGDVHRDRRASVDPPLRRSAVATYIEDLVRPIASGLADGLAKGESFDIVAEYFEPVSTLSLASMFGVGDIPSDTLRRWFHTVIGAASNYGFDEDTFAASDAVLEEIKQVLEPTLERLETAPDGTGLSRLLHAGMPEGQVRARQDVYSAFLIEITGGMQEPGHLLATTLLGLLQEGSYGRVVEDQSLIPSAITEALRWVAPVGVVFRETSRETVIHDQVVPQGALVWCVVGSANRDEKKFTEAENYRLDRTGPTHMSFGGGRHFCAGNVFGREVARIALEELSRVSAQIELAPEGFQMKGWLFRSPQPLHVVLPEGA